MSGLRKQYRKVGHKRRVALAILAMAVLMAAGLMAAAKAASATAGHQNRVQVVKVVHAVKSAGQSTFSWDGKKGLDACSPGTTGNMLWIFNPHSGATPVSMTITWSTGETDTYTSGWINPGGSQDWHLTVDIVGKFPPQAAYVTYTGTLGHNPILTISGCNESGGGTTTTGTTQTTTTQTTTTQTTTTGTTVTTTTTVPTTVTTTTTVPTTTTTPKPPKPPHHHKKPHVPKKHHPPHPIPAPPVQGYTG